MTNIEAIETLRANYPDACYEQLREAVDDAIQALKAQDATGDTISRQSVLNILLYFDESRHLEMIKKLPSAQPKLYGYDIKHLELIANVLLKENLTPERITEVLTDIGRIVVMVRDEFEETLRKAVEQFL